MNILEHLQLFRSLCEYVQGMARITLFLFNAFFLISTQQLVGPATIEAEAGGL